jgi:hypothetical protein
MSLWNIGIAKKAGANAAGRKVIVIVAIVARGVVLQVDPGKHGDLLVGHAG